MYEYTTVDAVSPCYSQSLAFVSFFLLGVLVHQSRLSTPVRIIHAPTFNFSIFEPGHVSYIILIPIQKKIHNAVYT